MFADASLWRILNPDATIEENEPLQGELSYRLTEKERKEQISLLKEDGYCFLPSVIDSRKVERMSACIHTLVERNIPPVYCFVYDMFWQLILELDPVLTDLLGDYLIIPNAWTWNVDGKKPGVYFPPHRDVADEDFIDDQGMPTLFSLWIPLTDVTTKSSCIYLLPASRDPAYPHEAINWRIREKQEGRKPWNVEDLVNIRALPAPKGSLLGWNGGVLHWGSKPHPNAPPRVSIGYYFHSMHSKKKHPGLVDLRQPLTLQRRMNIIFANLRMYGKSLQEV